MTDRSGTIDTLSPSFTLSDYEVEEVSIGKAAKLLEMSKRHSPGVAPVADMNSGNDRTASSILDRDFPYRDAGGYEVDELEVENFATWNFGRAIDSREASED